MPTLSCDPSDLALSAKDFQKLQPELKRQIDTYLLAVIAGVTPDPSAMALAAKDFQNVAPEDLIRLQVYLLCQIVNL
jgi:hypothetical protein